MQINLAATLNSKVFSPLNILGDRVELKVPNRQHEQSSETAR